MAFAVILGSSYAFAQQAFDSAEAALVHAVATSDPDGLRTVLGPQWKRYIPIDDIDAQDVYAFLGDWAKSHNIKIDADGRAHLAVGPDEWTLPIPIVRHGSSWRFDTHAEADEMKTRRIGRNELSAIQAVLAYYDAQQEYALVDRNGDGGLE